MAALCCNSCPCNFPASEAFCSFCCVLCVLSNLGPLRGQCLLGTDGEYIE